MRRLLTAEKNLAQLRVDALALQGSADAAQAAQAKNAVDAARLMICAMRKRKESRGGHYRTDYPDHDPALANPIQTLERVQREANNTTVEIAFSGQRPLKIHKVVKETTFHVR